LIVATVGQYGRRMRPIVVAVVLLATAAVPRLRAALPPDAERALREATYVYVQSERKDGSWSKPAEIWFHVDGGRVCVGTRPSSWRIRRIGWGRTKARIAVGKPDGPAFEATGAVVHDAALEARLMDDYAKKYPEGWKKFEQSFRDGFKSGERVVACYTPK
jgi:hypothetical protein